MTNPKKHRRNISNTEFRAMLKKAEELPEYLKLRAKAILALFRTGKRRGEVAALEMEDLSIEENFLVLEFTVEKKQRKDNKKRKPKKPVIRRKKFPLESWYALAVLEYYHYVKANHAESKYLFPSMHFTFFGNKFSFDYQKHLSGRQVLRIIKSLNPTIWCHLFRSTRAQEIVKADERKGQLNIFTVYKVKHALDLEREATAWNYLSNYATEIVQPEETEIDLA